MPIRLAEKVPGPRYMLRGGCSLAGRSGVVYGAWRQQGQPLNQGWHIGSDDLVRLAAGGRGDSRMHAVVLDIKPDDPHECLYLELTDVWAFTYATNGRPDWTPLMLRMREVHKEWSDEGEVHHPRDFFPQSGPEIIEFLYVRGEDGGWNWGAVGRMNGALLDPEARRYFVPILAGLERSGVSG